jgi:hypothetical protein
LRLAAFLKTFIEEHPDQKFLSSRDDEDEDISDDEELDDTETDNETSELHPPTIRSRRQSGNDGENPNAAVDPLKPRLRLGSANSLNVAGGNEFMGNLSTTHSP